MPDEPSQTTRKSDLAEFVVGLVLAPFLFYFMGTGSPIPLWSVRKLNDPVGVARVAADRLILEDGREVRLKYMATLPQDNPTFLAAIIDGVEIDEEGHVNGSCWTNPNCLNDPVLWYKSRGDLALLAAALCPEKIDRELVSDRAIGEITDQYRLGPRRNNPRWLSSSARSVLYNIQCTLEEGAEENLREKRPPP